MGSHIRILKTIEPIKTYYNIVFYKDISDICNLFFMYAVTNSIIYRVFIPQELIPIKRLDNISVCINNYNDNAKDFSYIEEITQDEYTDILLLILSFRGCDETYNFVRETIKEWIFN